MGRRTRPWVAVVLALALGGCEISRVDPAAAVHVAGRALDAGGRPLAGATLRLYKEADVGEALFGVFLAVGTLGTVCLSPAAPAICRKARTATTGADGSYRFELKGSDTQGLVGNASTMDLVIPGGDGGSATASFKVRSTAVSLPDIRLWSAGARLGPAGAGAGGGTGAGGIRLEWAALPGEAGRDPTYSLQLLDARTRALLWSQPSGPTGGGADSRVVEDVATVAVASAVAAVGDVVGDVRVGFVSPAIDVAGSRAGAPPSRGKPCSAVNAGDLSTTTQATCAATDGDLTSPGRLTGNGSGVVSGVVVDLGSARRIGFVVARGVAGDVVVEGSGDGNAWSDIGKGTGPIVSLTTSATARAIRLRSPGGLDESLLAELSVW